MRIKYRYLSTLMVIPRYTLDSIQINLNWILYLFFLVLFVCPQPCWRPIAWPINIKKQNKGGKELPFLGNSAQ